MFTAMNRYSMYTIERSAGRSAAFTAGASRAISRASHPNFFIDPT